MTGLTSSEGRAGPLARRAWLRPDRQRESFRSLLCCEALIAFAIITGVAGLVAIPSNGGEAGILLGAMAVSASGGIIGRRRLLLRAKVATAQAIIGLACAWGLLVVLGAGIYLLTGSSDSLIDAGFESSAGFSTVAATTMDVDALSTPILVFRSATQWVGGLIGLFAAAVALPATMKGRVQIPKGEGSRANRLSPDLATGRRRVLQIYLALTGMCWLAYLAAGLSLRSSTVHALSTVSTGGFSDRPDSLTSAPVAVQTVATVFMIVAGCSYYALFWLIRGNAKRFSRSPEARVYLGIISAVTLWALWQVDGLSFGKALFTAASASSTTGFAVFDWTAAPSAMLAAWLVAIATGAMSAG